MTTTQQTYDSRPAPAQTIETGARVLCRNSHHAYGATREDAGTVLGYATPDLKQSQMWSHESYFVRFDKDAPNARRVFSVQDITVIA